MKIWNLSIVLDSKNSKRIQEAKNIENPEIPDIIYLEKDPIWFGVDPKEKNSIIIRHGEAAISRKHCVVQHE